MKKLLYILLLICGGLNAQSLSIQQDAKLLFLGDGNSYEAGTMDLLVTFKGYSDTILFGGVASVNYQFEHAKLIGTYNRACAGIGYTQSIKKLYLSLDIYGGYIWRWERQLLTYSFDLSASYPIYKGLRVIYSLQTTYRSDLKWRYDLDIYRMSGFIGLIYNFK